MTRTPVTAVPRSSDVRPSHEVAVDREGGVADRHRADRRDGPLGKFGTPV